MGEKLRIKLPGDVRPLLDAGGEGERLLRTLSGLAARRMLPETYFLNFYKISEFDILQMFSWISYVSKLFMIKMQFLRILVQCRYFIASRKLDCQNQ